MHSEFRIEKILLAAVAAIVFTAGINAQTPTPPAKDIATPVPAAADTKATATPTPTPDAKGPAQDNSAEAEAILPYYVNYLKEYRLGPNDVITIEVFGQCPDYCKSGITVPPTAKISYPLIREGVMVGGKTVEQVAAEVTKKLDEYIIDPKVTVTLDRAMSNKYSVLGKVVTPGVHVLDRKISVYEAVVESGGVAKDGDIRKVIVYSYNGQGQITSKFANIAELQKGRGEMIFLKPGDQVFVSGKGFSIEKVFDILSKASIIRMFMGGGLPF